MIRDLFTKSDLKVFGAVVLYLVAIPVAVATAETMGVMTDAQASASTLAAVVAVGVFVVTRELYRPANPAAGE